MVGAPLLPDLLRVRVELVCVELVPEKLEEEEEEEEDDEDEEEEPDEEPSVLEPVAVLVCVVELALEDSVAALVELEEVCVMTEPAPAPGVEPARPGPSLAAPAAGNWPASPAAVSPPPASAESAA